LAETSLTTGAAVATGAQVPSLLNAPVAATTRLVRAASGGDEVAHAASQLGRVTGEAASYASASLLTPGTVPNRVVIQRAQATIVAEGSSLSPVVVANTLEATDAVAVVGRNATQRAASYEAGVRGIYGEAPLSQRTYAAPHNPSGIGRADKVADIDGRQIAIEAKYTDDWARSPFNPQSMLPWAVGERARMVTQARNYDAVFDGIIYHTNSVDLANFYSRMLSEAGVTNFKFVITPATR
jgi:hypothetical protein